MTEIEIIEKQSAQLTDRLDRATARIEVIAQERQRLGYDLHINQSKDAAAQLGKLADELRRLSEEKETLSGAIAELKRRATDAARVVARTEALSHIKRIEELLVALVDCAPQLDLSWGHISIGQAGGYRHVVGPKNPPLFVEAGTLVAEIFGELKALGLDRGVSWPARGRGFGIGTAEDLRRASEAAVKQYQHCGLPSSRNFVGLIDALSNSVRTAMKQHEHMEAA
jgi:hypothetical protein